MNCFVLDPIQEAVDEASRVIGSVLFPEVDRFVQSHLGGHLFAEKQFEKSNPEDASIDNRHALQTPVFREPLNEVIDHLRVFEYAEDKAFRKFVSPSIRRKVVLKLSENFGGVLLADIQLIKNLEG